MKTETQVETLTPLKFVPQAYSPLDGWICDRKGVIVSFLIPAIHGEYFVRAVNRDHAFEALLLLVKEFTGFVNVTIDFHNRCVAAVAQAEGGK